jgi:transcription initiation factor TFIIF subunit beta
MEGTIVEKLECRPYADQTYMTMKAKSIMVAAQPKRKVEQLDTVVTKFKPISDHKHNVRIRLASLLFQSKLQTFHFQIEYERKKKTDGKKSRTDKTAVMDMLFNAFEKHQYYNIKDLVTLTNQPISYLKEILKEICEYSVKNPHKNTWHLKPEYRHYSEEKKEGQKKEEAGDKMSDSEDDF